MRWARGSAWGGSRFDGPAGSSKGGNRNFHDAQVEARKEIDLLEKLLGHTCSSILLKTGPRENEM